MENKLIISLEHEGDLWNIVPNHSTTLNLIVLQKVAIELSKRLGLILRVSINLKMFHTSKSILSPYFTLLSFHPFHALFAPFILLWVE